MSCPTHLIRGLGMLLTLDEDAVATVENSTLTAELKLLRAGFKYSRTVSNFLLSFHPFFPFPFFLVAVPPPPPDEPPMLVPSTIPPPCACISFIMSFKIFSLTPPPLSAGECKGNIVFSFHPLGTAGGESSFSGIGIPWMRNCSGDSGVVGCERRYADTRR